MSAAQIASALPLALLLAGCGESQNAAPENRQAPDRSTTPTSSKTVYSGVGEVIAIRGDRITISHGPIEEIGWPAMAMTFRSESPDLSQSVSVGDRVSFAFRQDGGDYPLTSITKGD
jgi:Cu/Ag efflux protein CusF